MNADFIFNAIDVLAKAQIIIGNVAEPGRWLNVDKTREQAGDHEIGNSAFSTDDCLQIPAGECFLVSQCVSAKPL